MSDYWKNLFDSISTKQSLFEQVGKTLNGRPISEDQLNLIAESAAEALQLGVEDMLVDLCCGNGLLTERLAPRVNYVLGVDYSRGLIEVAQRNSNPKSRYMQADVLKIDWNDFPGITKVVMNEALQHFSEQQFGTLLTGFHKLSGGTSIFIGGVPDREKLRDYYDTDEKFSFYLQREREGRPHMGRWWTRQEIIGVARASQLSATILPQKADMITAYYRFDVLLKVPGDIEHLLHH